MQFSKLQSFSSVSSSASPAVAKDATSPMHTGDRMIDAKMITLTQRHRFRDSWTTIGSWGMAIAVESRGADGIVPLN